MVDTEREILQEKQKDNFGERRPFDSSRQATYEDTLRDHDRDWDHDDRD